MQAKLSFEYSYSIRCHKGSKEQNRMRLRMMVLAIGMLQGRAAPASSCRQAALEQSKFMTPLELNTYEEKPK